MIEVRSRKHKIVLILIFLFTFVFMLPHPVFASWQLEKSLFYSKEDIPLLNTVLLFSEVVDPSIDADEIKQQVKGLADQIRPEISGIENPKEILAVLRKFIYKKWKFQPPQIEGMSYGTGYYDTLVRFSKESPDEIYQHSFLASVLETKTGNCLGLTSLYLVLAEELDLPIFPVFVPYHIFPRYDDGKVRLNIEATAGGIILDDSFYIKVCRLSEELIKNEVYLKTLDKKDFFSTYYLALGSYYSGKGLFRKAKKFFQKSLALSPHLALAYTNLAFIYSYYGMSTVWSGQVKSAFDIDPDFLGGYLSLSDAYTRAGKVTDAVSVMEKAIKKYPDLAHAYATLGELYLMEGRLDEAVRVMQDAIKIVPWDPDFYVSLAKIYYFKTEYDTAWSYARKAEKLGMKNPTIIFMLKRKSPEPA